ncbi:hypothetical protein HY256_10155, partial [Candidatus Sumerlaeota bacterium]|nr:hypothetical protein [Candidatus Sumerlaeota bacterium]
MRYTRNVFFEMAASLVLLAMMAGTAGAAEAPSERIYQNELKRLKNPKPLLADHPEYFDPITEELRFEAPAIVDDEKADLDVRAWRFSYNARGIIEMPNHLRAAETALIVVHPWGVDDGQGWRTPEPAGVCDFCTPVKNQLSHEHIQKVLNPFIKSLRGKVGLVMYSQPYGRDGIREKIYRTFEGKPSEEERRKGLADLKEKLNSFNYKGEPIPREFKIGSVKPVVDYFKQFPGLDSTAKYNGEGFWDLPNPIVKSIDVDPDDILIFDGEGYDRLKKFLEDHKIRHVLLAGY